MLLEKEFWRSFWQRPGEWGAHALLKKAARKPKNLLKSKDRGKLRKKNETYCLAFFGLWGRDNTKNIYQKINSQ